MHISAFTWSVFAASAALVVAFLGAFGLLLGLIALARMRRDLKAVQAAERFESVDLNSLVQKYLPAGQQSQKASQEIPLIKQAIAMRRPRSRRMVIVSGVLLLCAAVPVAHYLRHLDIVAALRGQRPVGREYVDALSAIQGVWGWNADFEQSCQRNPQTVTVSPDHKTVSIDYAKPREPSAHLVFAVVSTAPNVIVMKYLNNSYMVNVRFLNPNAYVMSFDQLPLASTGSIVRCPATGTN